MAKSKLTNQHQNQLDAIAEHFAARKRRGECPSISDYVQRYPDLAEELRELLPVVEMLDQARQEAMHAESNPSVDLPIGPGTRLGEYQLIRRIGRGGMGIVYQAEHMLLGSSVAIKLLRRPGDQPKLRERFQREASAAARIHHRHIVRVFDFGNYGESLYYVMSLVEGWGLNQIIASSDPPESVVGSAKSSGGDDPTDRDQPPTRLDLVHSELGPIVGDDTGRTSEALSETGIASFDRTEMSSGDRSGSDSLWTWAARIGVQAADALDYAHSMGIVHRDIKPANLLLDIDSNVFITDFGLAKIENSADLTDTGDILGTLRYMPPEAFVGRSDARSDIYGLGLTLYEAVTGQPAYRGSQRGQLVSAITDGRVERLGRKVPKIPVDLASIIHKSIDMDPTRRYQSAGEFRDDLTRFLSGQPVQARRATWAYNTARWIGRNRTVSALAGLLLVFLVLSSVLFGVSARRFQKLAIEREIQRNHALEKTKEASLNLLRANLSDARGWTTSSTPGQRVNGVKSLSAAIDLARRLNVFDQYRSEINTIAATLATLNDVPLETSWRHPVAVDHYAPIEFSGDLSIYVHNDYRDATPNCRVYESGTDPPRLVETIPIPGRIADGTLRVSTDGNLLAGWIQSQSGFELWVHNRSTDRTYRPGFCLPGIRLLKSLDICGDSHRVAYLTSERKLSLFDGDTGQTWAEYAVPRVDRRTGVSANPSGTRAVLFGQTDQQMSLIDFVDGSIEDLDFDDHDIVQVAWRPDERQIALVGGRISIWDFSRGQVCGTLNHANVHVTELEYSGDGRLLFSSGWSGFTEVHDVSSQRQVMRCEPFIATMSRDGRRAAFHSTDELQIRSVVSADALSAFNYSETDRTDHASVDAKSGLLWLAPSGRLLAIDLVNHRMVDQCEFRRTKTFVAVDPEGREVFAAGDGKVFRMPVKYDSSDKTIQFGPYDALILARGGESNQTDFAIDLSSRGDQLAALKADEQWGTVLRRDDGWFLGLGIDQFRGSTALSAHPQSPVVVSHSHHHPEIVIARSDEFEVEFRLPYRKARAYFTPDGKRLLVCAEGSFEAYRVEDWEKIAESSPDLRIENHAFALSPKGAWAAVQTYQPRGATILSTQNFQPALLLAGNHLDPESRIGSFDGSGRFFVADRGDGIIGVWDLYRLRRHFETLDLPWPLPGLGKFVPLRDPALEITIDWRESPSLSIRRRVDRFDRWFQKIDWSQWDAETGKPKKIGTPDVGSSK